MRICYPIVKPKSRPFQQIEPALRAALKYEMELPIAMLSDELLAHAVHYPLKVWAIACRTGLEDVARRAAELMLSSATLDILNLEDTDGITAGHVFRLHEFHRLRGKVEFSFKLLTPPLTDGQAIDEPSPLTRFVPDVPDPDVVLISSDEVEFPVHRGVISAASPLLKAKLDDALRAVSDDSNVASSSMVTLPSIVTLPKLSLDAPATVLASLLQRSYPGGSNIPSDPSHVVDLLVTSERLGMDRVHRAILERWNAIASQKPILAFLYATRAGLTDCAKQAAKSMLESDLEGVYIRDMEHAPPLPYHRLLMHYRSCREIAKSILSDISNHLRDTNYYHDISRPTSSVPSSPGHRFVPVHQPIIIQSPFPNTMSYHSYGARHGAPSTAAWLTKHLEQISDTLEQKPG
ncbi:hypothetical protein C8Q80DRAFT_244246 [Daedaleopsis nitida]|nr:hypothetical protein C8Q80DRAFT_244246 [Daedaleopsis nitida]